MTHDVRPKSEAQALQEIAARLYKVEQRSSSAQPAGTTTLDPNPDVSTITIGGIVVGADASPATGLTLSTAAYMEDIWIDADWSAPTDGTAANYDVELSKKTGSSYDIVQNYRTGTGTGIRMHALEPQTTYGVRVTAINRIGVRSDPEPAIGFTDITTGIDATVPAQVTGLSVTAALRSFLVKWNEVTDRDVARGTGQYRLQWSLSNTFSALIGDIYTTSTVESVLFDTPTTSLIYFRVAAIDNSGNTGAWSSTISGTLGLVVTNDLTATSVTTAKIANLAVDNTKLAALAVDAAKLADSAVTSTKIANLAVGTAAIAALAVGTAQIADASILTAKIGDAQITTAKITDLSVTNAKIGNLAVDNAKINDLDAAKITAGTISAARIASNSIDVDKLTASTLTSKTITLGAGGTLKIGTAPTTGILINDQGIRLYSGGVVKVALDVAGTASFEGNISASTITSSTLTSATINSGTITGTTVRTAASGQRIALEAGFVDSLRMYSGSVSESTSGQLAVAVSGSSLTCNLISPKSSGNDFALAAVYSVNGGGGSGAGFQISNSSGATKAQFILVCTSNGALPYVFIDKCDELHLQCTSNADVKLRGSGNYSFVYFYGGGTEATINVNNGLGAGIHIMNGTNASFLPVQASAFNVSSARAVKENIRTEEESALGRIRRLEVVRFNRINDPEIISKRPTPKTLGAHISRERNLEEIGLIADDVIDIVPEAVLTDEHGNPRSINLSVLLTLALKAIQELAAAKEK